MLYIEKEGLPDEVSRKIIKICKDEKWKNIDENDTNAIRNIFNNEFPKDEVKEVLIHEQRGLCAYCMRRIHRDSHSRVEHFIPLSKDKEKALDYNNMLGVCDGGEKTTGQKKRIVCCDAHKSELEIFTSPLNKVQMDKIAYRPDGRIYTNPKDATMERDINEILLLNGITKPDGSVRDTATEILKGRRDAYDRAREMMRRMKKKGKCTSSSVKKVIETLINQEEREEYVGVKLYYFKKKYESLKRQGL
ncbi:MAG: retron system putative HNH endonuclease [Lachnospiraceae bacterium]